MGYSGSGIGFFMEGRGVKCDGSERKVVYFLSLCYPCGYHPYVCLVVVVCAFSCGIVAPFHSL